MKPTAAFRGLLFPSFLHLLGGLSDSILFQQKQDRAGQGGRLKRPGVFGFCDYGWLVMLPRSAAEVVWLFVDHVQEEGTFRLG